MQEEVAETKNKDAFALLVVFIAIASSLLPAFSEVLDSCWLLSCFFPFQMKKPPTLMFGLIFMLSFFLYGLAKNPFNYYLFICSLYFPVQNPSSFLFSFLKHPLSKIKLAFLFSQAKAISKEDCFETSEIVQYQFGHLDGPIRVNRSADSRESFRGSRNEPFFANRVSGQ